MLKNNGRNQSGHAHGKIILIGEHAVVYGYPAIVWPLTNLSVTARVGPTPTESMLDCALYRGPLEQVPRPLQGLALSIAKAIERFGGRHSGLRIRIASSIPPSRGLGSSAAVVASVIRAVAGYYHMDLSHRSLMRFVRISEEYTHGSPSGVDSEAVVSPSPLWFVKGQAVSAVSVKTVPHFVVADSGESSDTRSVVETVGFGVQRTPRIVYERFERLGELAHLAKASLGTGDLTRLGQTLHDAQHELSSLGVSHPALERLIQVANGAGALGSKLTGSGLGGCVVTLASNAVHAEKLSTVLMKVGAKSIWHVTPSREESPL